MDSTPDAMSEELVGKIQIGAGDATAITMSRWHWQFLHYMTHDLAMEVVGEITERCDEFPEYPPSQVVIWYVETAYEQIVGEEDAS